MEFGEARTQDAKTLTRLEAGKHLKRRDSQFKALTHPKAGLVVQPGTSHPSAMRLASRVATPLDLAALQQFQFRPPTGLELMPPRLI